MINWRKAKSTILAMSLEDKRRLYKCRGQFKTISDIVDWGTYARSAEGAAVLLPYQKRDNQTQTNLRARAASDEKKNTDKDEEVGQSENVKTSAAGDDVKNEKTSIDEGEAKPTTGGIDEGEAKPTTSGTDVERMDGADENKAAKESTLSRDGSQTKMEVVTETDSIWQNNTPDRSKKRAYSEDKEVAVTSEIKASDKPTLVKQDSKMEVELTDESKADCEKAEIASAYETKVSDEPSASGSKSVEKSATIEDTAKQGIDVTTFTDEIESSSNSPVLVIDESESRESAAQSDPETEYAKDDVLNRKVSLFVGDITCLEIDAIVNAANDALYCGGGVDNAIHNAAGYGFLRSECEDLEGCDTGDAKITGGYKLPAKYVIHAVGPKGEYPSLLKGCYNRAMDLLKEHELETIAFPCISTGIYGYPNENAANVALKTIRNWLETDEYGAKVKRVIFCLFLQRDIDIYRKLMLKYFPIE